MADAQHEQGSDGKSPVAKTTPGGPFDPPPRLALSSSLIEHEIDEALIARLYIGSGHEEIAALLDGLDFSKRDDLIGLVQLVIFACSGQIKGEIDDEEYAPGYAGTVAFGQDVEALSARLSLAGRVYRHLLEEREGDVDLVKHEGYEAEVWAMIGLKDDELRVSGPERDAIVALALEAIQSEVPEVGHGNGELTPAQCQRISELSTLLTDTGWENGPGVGCLLTSLPRPRLREWLKRLTSEAREQLEADHGTPDEAESRRRLDLVREVWVRARSTNEQETNPDEAAADDNGFSTDPQLREREREAIKELTDVALRHVNELPVRSRWREALLRIADMGSFMRVKAHEQREAEEAKEGRS